MKKQIVLLACFSNEEIRKHLSLGYSWFNVFFRYILKKPGIANRDLSPWISDYIKVFETLSEYEFHIISMHSGMEKQFQRFSINGINYHFINRELPLLIRLYDKVTDYLKRSEYRRFRKKIVSIVEDIHPDLFILSGAENIDYSIASLYVNTPQLIILQTLLNSKKRLSYGVGNPFRREMEKIILKNGDFFAVSEKEEETFIRELNPNALFFPFVYPTSQPPLFPSERKEYDFIFFAGVLSKFKGTSDVIYAFGKVIKKYTSATLAIIGDCPEKYKSELEKGIESTKAKRNIIMLGSFQSHQEMFKYVQKAKYAVLPGITAPLNTTVRESMLLGMPTIVYGNEVTATINSNTTCIVEAIMESVDDLSEKMIFALENESKMTEIGQCGKKYADSHFSPQAVGNNLKHIINKCLDASIATI